MSYPVSPDYDAEIRRLFDALVEVDVADRPERLDELCPERPDLRQEVEALLEAYGRADAVLTDLTHLRPAPPSPTASDASDPHQLVGRTISHYQVLEYLGGGGMGVVYKACDAKLDRMVALKFLPSHLGFDEEAKRRFVREAKAASALDHVNICTIYEIGEAEDGHLFIAMACYEGETLKKKIQRGPLEVEEALGYAMQIAEGLSRAHAAGIVHRDVKPANVLVTEEGTAKLVDFGIAKMVGTDVTAGEGAALGTVAYMSPEQARGKTVDQRTDLWSLGVVLYEMLTGAQPFRGDNHEAVIYSILNEEPEPAKALREEIPAGVATLQQRCLAKAPAERFQTAEELLGDLKHCVARSIPAQAAHASGKTKPHASRQHRTLLYLGLVTLALLSIAALMLLRSREMSIFAGTAADGTSIAVLPFVNVSADEENEYFSDGITEELINTLGRIEGLRVPARTSSFAFKGKQVDIREIGARLNVKHVLEGSVRKRGDRLRITAQLIGVENGYPLWAETYDREIGGLFAVQEDLAREIVGALKEHLVQEPEEVFVKPATENMEAYHLYLKGQYFWNQRDREGLLKAVDYFTQAIEVDSTYALAYAGLAHAYTPMASLGFFPAKEIEGKLKAAALKALELDPNLAEAHVSMSAYKVLYEWDLEGGLQAKRRAIALNPNYATAYQWYGWDLQAMGRHDENLAARKRALELDPLSPIINSSLGGAFRLTHQYDKAIAQHRSALELDPGFWGAHEGLGLVFEQQGRHEEAIAAFQQAVALSGGVPFAQAALGHVYAQTEQIDKAEEILEALKQPSEEGVLPFYGIAIIHTALGEKDEAFAWLEKAYEARLPQLLQVNAEPRFDPLRSDPRFTALLEKIGLPGTDGALRNAGLDERLRAAWRLAVLPLKNNSSDPEQGYFATGMTEALLAELSKVEALRVISLMRHEEVDKSLPQLLEELEVEVVLEGGVVSHGAHVGITARLTEVGTNDVLWSERFEGELRNVVTLQREVALAVAHKVVGTLTPQEVVRLSTAEAVDEEAIRLYLRGIQIRHDNDDSEAAAPYFEQAVEKDPGFALGWAWLANVSAIYGNKARAEQAVEKALALNPSLPEAYVALGLIRQWIDWDWTGAEQAFRHAIELNPGDGEAHHELGQLLMRTARSGEALIEMKRALQANPLALRFQLGVGEAYFYGQRYDEALEVFEEITELSPEFLVAHWYTGHVYWQKGMTAQATKQFERWSGSPGDLGMVNAVAGRSAEAWEAHKTLAELPWTQNESFYPHHLVSIPAALGDKETALDWLERAYDERSDLLIYLKIWPSFGPLRSEPRFQAVLRKVGLEG